MQDTNVHDVLHTVAVRQVIQVIKGAENQGHDTHRLLKRAGIDPGLLGFGKARVTQSQYASLILVLRRTTKDELWGLSSAPLPMGSFAHICRHLIYCRSLDEAIRSGLSVYRLLTTNFVPRLIVRGDVARIEIRFDDSITPERNYAKRSFCFFTYGLMSWLAARRIPLLSFSLPRGNQRYGSEAGRLFKTQVRHGTKTIGLEFEARWLDLPVVQTVESLEVFLQGLPANLLIRYRDRSTLTERIRAVLKRHSADCALSLDELGDILDMSVPTLRRRLRQEGQNFQAIKDAVRRDLAIAYLQDPALTLSDIALRLGFSEPSTFHRAFKSWTGVAPGCYRQTHVFSGALQ